MTTFAADILSGKVAFVAGGTGGINLGIAEALGRAGARVAVASRSEERVSGATAELAAKGIEAMGVTADVRDYARVAQVFGDVHAKWGTIDIVVSGAAGNFLAPVIGMSANAFKTVVDIDLLGTFNVFRASWDFLTRPGASLIAITAGQAVTPKAFQAHACAAKAGVNMLTQCLALEWGPGGVRVNAISPGPIAGTEGMARLTPTPEATAAFKSRLALRDYGELDDIGAMSVFLCSPAAKYITGSIFNVDGGTSLGDASTNALHVPARAAAAKS